MADLVTKLRLEGSDFGKTLNDATKQVGDFQKKTQDASKSVNDMGQASSRTASELLKQMKSMENLGRSAGDYRGQLAQITRQISDLTINYRNMSDEMKNSDFGKEVAAKIDELTVKAGEYKDAILDAQASIKALSSDTGGWDAIKQGIDVASSSLQAFTAMGVLSANTTEKLVAVLAKLKAMEVATSAVIKIGNALQKQSALMMGIAKIQALALAKAKALETSATKAATVAQRIFNTVAKSNPYVLLATVILTVITALVAFTNKTNKARKEEEELQKATDKTREKVKQFNEALSSSYADQITTYNKLRTQWQTLTTAMEKTQFIKDAKTEFDKLGVSINNISDAEKVLEGNTEKMFQIFKIRALAAAYAKAAADAYNEAIAFETEHNFTEQGQIIQRPQHQNALYGEYDKENDIWTYTAEGAEEANKEFHNIIGATEDINKNYEKGNVYTKKQIQLEQQLQEEMRKLGLSGSNNNNNNGGSSTPTPEIKPDEGSLSWWQKKVSELQTQLNNLSPDSEQFEPLKAELNAAKDKVSEIQDLMKTPTPIGYDEGSLTALSNKVNEIQTQLNNTDPHSDRFQELVQKLIEAKEELVEIQNIFDEIGKEAEKPFTLVPPETGNTIKSLTDEVNRIKSALEETEPGTAAWDYLATALTNWEKALDDISLKYDMIGGKVDEIANMSGMISNLSSINSSVSSIGSSVETLNEGWDESKSAIENITSQIGAVFNIIQSVVSIIQIVQTICEAINTLETINAAIQTEKAAATASEIGPQTTLVALKEQEAVANVVSGGGQVAESASKIPYVGWAIGLAAVAAFIALIATAKSSASFAKGGIVPGTSFSGDNVSAQLNSGEMVLTQTQQKNLFNLLDGGAGASGSGGKVEFVIKGQELKGVLNNYDKKMSRV